MPTVDDVIQLLASRGDSQYGGEAVSQIEHALQSAYLAEQEQRTPELIVAALLHDVGHLLHDLPDDAPDTGIDDHHENSAVNYLNGVFPESVTEPIRLHVAAKRYLCATRPEYQGTLSQPSIISLGLQGGPMSSEEQAEFQNNPYAEGAVRLRYWDDAAKIPQLATPALDHFAAYMRKAAVQDAAS